MKCSICKKKLAECHAGEDETKYCQGHTAEERKRAENLQANKDAIKTLNNFFQRI